MRVKLLAAVEATGLALEKSKCLRCGTKKLADFYREILGCPDGQKALATFFSEAMISDLHEDWKAHGIQAIREVRERRPAEYLRIVAMIVSRCDGLSGMADGLHDEALEQIIEERRRQALLSIEKMREPR